MANKAKPSRPRGGASPPAVANDGSSGNGNSRGWPHHLALVSAILTIAAALVSLLIYFVKLELRVDALERDKGSFEARIEAHLNSKNQPENADGAISKEQLTSILQDALDCEGNDKTYDVMNLKCTPVPKPPKEAMTPADK